MIKEDFIASIPINFNGAVKYIIDAFSSIHTEHKSSLLPHYKEYVEYYSLFEAYLKSKDYSFTPLGFVINKEQNIGAIVSFFSMQRTALQVRLDIDFVKDTRERFDIIFSNSFSYEFSDGDLKIIQNQINEIRDLINSSEWFTDDHKQRMLKRLEKLQSELHKKVSDLDKFWGFFVDASIVFGIVGENAKPFFDRIKDLMDIIWRTQARAEELPSNAQIPFLPRNTTDKNE